MNDSIKLLKSEYHRTETMKEKRENGKIYVLTNIKMSFYFIDTILYTKAIRFSPSFFFGTRIYKRKMFVWIIYKRTHTHITYILRIISAWGFDIFPNVGKKGVKIKNTKLLPMSYMY